MSAQPTTPEVSSMPEGVRKETKLTVKEGFERTRNRFFLIQEGLSRRLDELRGKAPEIVKEEVDNFAEQTTRLRLLDQSVTLPIESASHVASPASIVRFDTLTNNPEADRWIESGIEDEYNNLPARILTPLKEVIIDNNFGLEIKVNNEIKRQIEYLSRTGHLEWESDRVAKLQAISDGMTEGTDIQTRIVIINKGVEDTAFVMPDGTIFISQAILNKLTTFDRVGGVIAHEIGHLINKTAEISNQATTSQTQFGIGWVHEAKGDSDAPKLLEKVGLNSMGLALAIKDISGGERGSIHQTGISRASQNVIQHSAIDYSTSNKPEQLLTSEFKTDNLRMTNREIIQKSHTAKETIPLEVIEKLDREDFDYLVSSSQPRKEKLLEQQHALDTLKHCQLVIQKRLEQAGYSDKQINLFMFSVIQTHIPISLITSSEELLDLARETVPFDNKVISKKMYESLFNRDTSNTNIVFPFMYHIKENHFDKDKISAEWGIPVTQETLFEVLQVIKDGNYLRLQLSYNSNRRKHEVITQILYEYIAKLKSTNKISPDEMREFLIKAKDKQFQVNVDILEEYIKNKFSAEFVLNGDIIDLFREVFNQEKEKPKTLDELLDTFFTDFDKKFGASSHDFSNFVGEFVDQFRSTLDRQNLTDVQRLAYLNKFYKRVGNLSLETPLNLRRRLENEHDGSQDFTEENEFNRKVIQFNLRILAAVCFFTQDEDEFYSYTQRLMDESGLDSKKLSSNQLANLQQSIFASIDSSFGSPDLFTFNIRGIASFTYTQKKIAISNFEKLSQLPFIEGLRNIERPMFSTIQEINYYLNQQRNKLFQMGGDQSDIFSEDLFVLLTGNTLRASFQQIVEKGVRVTEYNDLFDFINDHYPSGIERDQFLREITMRYLSSSEVTIEEKTTYLKKHFDMIGPPGIVLVGEQINELSIYKTFRMEMGKHLESYLLAPDIIQKIALGDFLSSYATKNFEYLFETAQTNKEVKATLTNKLLEYWYTAFIQGGKASKDIVYDPASEKIALTLEGRRIFRSFKDIIDTLHNMSPLQRAAIAHKALTDREGALTSDANRTKLGEILLKGLDIKSSFVRNSIQKMIEIAPPEYLSFPVSQMLSPMLFRAIDVDFADVSQLELGKNDIPQDALEKAIKWDTRSITLFGARFAKQQGSFFLRRAGESDTQYKFASHHLRNLLLKNEKDTQTEDKKMIVNSSTESVIRGVEGTGPLGVRSLQLSRGAKRFSPELDARLADSFDSNPGLEKLRFWENLVKLSEGDEETGNFVENRLVRVENKLGGGSLFTTYRAKVQRDDGQIKNVVVKMLNPNALLFVGKTYDAAHQVLQSIINSETSSAEDKRYAQMGTMLIDLSNEWCIKDINDPLFRQDDALFRQTIERFNQRQGIAVMHAPELEFNTMKLKSEAEAENVTLNKYLNNPKIDMAKKREAVQTLGRFLVHQLRDTPVTDDTGVSYRLAHSDPHVGNYMVAEKENGIKMAAIDRSMYLRLSDEDVSITEALLRGDNIGFVRGFVERVCERNKWKGSQKYRFMASVFKDVLSEYAKQKVARTDDKFALLRIISEKVEKAGQTIPLEMRLMVRNVNALQQLMSEYGVSYKDIAK